VARFEKNQSRSGDDARAKENENNALRLPVDDLLVRLNGKRPRREFGRRRRSSIFPGIRNLIPTIITTPNKSASMALSQQRPSQLACTRELV